MFTNPGGSFSNPLTSAAYGFWGADSFNLNTAIDSLIGGALTGLQAGGVFGPQPRTGGGIPGVDMSAEAGVLPPNGFCQSVTTQTQPGVRMKRVVQVMKPNGEMTNYIHAGTAKTFSLASFKSRRRRCPR